MRRHGKQKVNRGLGDRPQEEFSFGRATLTINVARPAVNEKTDSYKAAAESHAPITYWRLDDEASGSTSTGGAGAGGGSPGSRGSDWTVNLTSGTIDATGGNYLDLSDDAAGTITLQDGSQVSFEGVERIEW